MKNNNDSITMTYSSLLSKDGKKAICVRFERNHGNDYAEALLPDHTITKQSGFTEDEINQIEFYLKVNKNEILEKSKEISTITHWFR